MPNPKPRTRAEVRQQLLDIIGYDHETSDVEADAIDTLAAAAGLLALDGSVFAVDLVNRAGVINAAITSGAAVLTSASNPWSAADVGAKIYVQGAGAAGATLVTTIAGFTSSGSVTLAVNASTSVVPSSTSTAGLAVWGDPEGDVSNLPVLVDGETDHMTVAEAFAQLGIFDASSRTVTRSYLGGADTLAGWASRFRDRRAASGLFKSPANMSGHRIGAFAYRVSADGYGTLLADLDRFMPGAGRDPEKTSKKIYYVDRVSGNNANTGLSWAQAFKSIQTAIGQADVDAVLVRGGQHYCISSTSDHMGTIAATRDISIIAQGPRATVSSTREVTWSANATYGAPVYDSSSPGGTVVKVLDTRSVDQNGDYTELTNVASALLVSTTPGSWFYDGSKVIMRLADGADPTGTSTTWCLRAAISARITTTGSPKLYFRNFDFIGSSGGAFSIRSNTLATQYTTFEDCWFRHQYNTNGLDAQGAGLCISINCRASANFADGFNYHQDSGTLIETHFVEINCVGYHNGTGGSDNGSTSHEANRGIRFNCDYGYNSGPGLIDVNTAKTFNVNVTSNNNGASTAADGLKVGDTAEMWVHGGSFSDNAGVAVNVEAGATLHYRDVQVDEACTLAGTVNNTFT